MKKLFTVGILLSSFLYSSISSEDITKMILKIKEERVGIGLNKLETTVSPFIMYVKKEKKVEKKRVKSVIAKVVVVEPVYTLDVILNHAAFINKKWYKKGDKLGKYRIGILGTSSVILKSKSGNKTLYIKHKKKKNIQLNQGTK